MSRLCRPLLPCSSPTPAWRWASFDPLPFCSARSPQSFFLGRPVATSGAKRNQLGDLEINVSLSFMLRISPILLVCTRLVHAVLNLPALPPGLPVMVLSFFDL